MYRVERRSSDEIPRNLTVEALVKLLKVLQERFARMTCKISSIIFLNLLLTGFQCQVCTLMMTRVLGDNLGLMS